MHIRRHISYIKYLTKHKWYVFRACRMIGGVPLLNAIIHDWTKFFPSEWGPYSRTFYNEDGSKKTFKNSKEFKDAWLLHIQRNQHHWEHWKEDPIPEKYIREMIADWIGAGMAIHGENEVIKWYEKNKFKIKLHPQTQEKVEELLALEVVRLFK